MRTDRTELWAVTVALALISLCAAASFLKSSEAGENVRRTTLSASIRLPRDSNSLLPGYNYFLLERLAEEQGLTPSIDIGGYQGGEACVPYPDSTDIVVLPLSDPAGTDGNLVSLTVDSTCLWVFRKSNRKLAAKCAGFLDGFKESEEYKSLRGSFLKAYNPFSSRGRSRLSPYDEIIRTHADSVKCDWRLLAAIIYQESNFHIEASSASGATGLMQLIPGTGRKHGAEDLTDPEQNISAGAGYLRRLSRMFSGISASPEERTKMMLAAYNAGEGRILDCITLAKHRDIDPGYWENLASVIPSMRDSSILDTVSLRCGLFKGHETIEYVDRVLDIYGEFRRICP